MMDIRGNTVDIQCEAPPPYSGGFSFFGIPLWSGTPHRKPFIHALTGVAFWCVGKYVVKAKTKDMDNVFQYISTYFNLYQFSLFQSMF
jgi:hypothetical protein